MSTILSVGDLLADRYEVQGYVGAGGMQEVYKAQDVLLQREVALKVPKDASATRRFKRSAALSARVNHSTAAKTLDYFEDTARPYLVEEFIDGQDFHKLRETLPVLDPYLVAHVLHHAARGVAASHHVGVVHRDLKPSNIMTSSDLSFRFVKITDFGIAKMAEEELAVAAEGGNESITGSHTMIGALPYMAPEMIQSPRTTGMPADIWALGSIAFELLSGEKPFGKGLVAVPNIVKGTIPNPPPYIAKSQFSGLGGELYNLIKSCWEPNPAARPNASEVVTACGSLCYPQAQRMKGTVSSVHHASWGFIASRGSEVFFHMDSVYGSGVAVGESVCFAAFPGEPARRAHPVVRTLR